VDSDPDRLVPPRRRLPNKTNFSRRQHVPRPSDDIPIALRTTSTGPETRSLSRHRSIVFFWGLIATAGFFLFLIGIFRPTPQGTKTLVDDVKIGNDGRLLGHFSYPEATNAQLVTVAPGMQLMPDAASSFLAMQRAAATDGVSLVLLSAFRSVAQQRQLFFDVKAERNETARDRAKVSAPPGFSEHSTGYAIDIGDLSKPQTNLSLDFVNTNAYQWLKNNAARYQYTLSFPEGNVQGVSFEPWHWRFEGSIRALRLFEPAQRLVKRSVSTPKP
jgi:D-alanyl-D-alanine carboxypeptidase